MRFTAALDVYILLIWRLRVCAKRSYLVVSTPLNWSPKAIGSRKPTMRPSYPCRHGPDDTPSTPSADH
jgi:hypothetical protein